jgi:hypothetical protein
MALILLVPLAVAVGVLGLSVSPLLTLLAVAGLVLVLGLTLGSQRTPGEPARCTYLCVCFALLPMTGVHVFSFLSIAEVAAFATLLVFVLQRRTADTGLIQRRSFALFAAFFFIVGGSLAAYWNGVSRGSFVEISELIVVAVPPALALRRFRPTRSDAMALMTAWVFGVAISAVAGLTVSKGGQGRAQGLATHANQLSMTCAMALPIVWALYRKGRLTRWQLSAAVVLLVATVLASGSRSGLLAAAIGVLILCLRSLGVLFTTVASAVVAVATASLLALTLTHGTSAVARLLNQSSTVGSDKKRLLLMHQGLERLDSLETRLLGSGFVHHNQPHNLFLIAWTGAGVLGIVGLLILACRPAFIAAQLTLDPFEWSLAVCYIVFLLATSVNNALPAPFAWAVFALLDFRWSQDAPGPATQASATSTRTATGLLHERVTAEG